MDHVWQIARGRPARARDARGLHALGYLAAVTERVELLAWVTAVVYREPGLLAKAVTTLDVLSEGRAWLGIGAAWNEEESRGLGLPFPRTAERFERLEETLQICLQMWSDDDGPYAGKHYQLGRTLNSPQSRAAPAPADPDRRRRRAEDAAAGRAVRRRPATSSTAPSSRTSSTCCAATATTSAATTTRSRRPSCVPIDPGPDGENVDAILEHLRELAALGVTHVRSMGVADGSRTDVARAHRRADHPRGRQALSEPGSSAADDRWSTRAAVPACRRGVSRLQVDQWSSVGDEGVCRVAS